MNEPTKIKNITFETKVWPLYSVVFLLLTTVFLLSLGDVAYASTVHSEIGTTLCKSAAWFQGHAGKGIAVIGVCIVGIGGLLNIIKWTTAITVGVGISLLFNADAIILAISGYKCSSAWT